MKKKHVVAKSLSPSALVGQQGVNLIESIVLKMGSRWNPAGPNETGIDGYIELYDPATGQPTGLHLSVQSKAVTTIAVRGDHAVYDCARRDVEYWLRVQPPLILVLSCPATGDAYWIPARDQFDGAPDGSVTARFDREADRFSERAYAALLAAAGRLSLPNVAAPKLMAQREVLFSNLVPLRTLPPAIWIGRGRYGSRYEASDAVRAASPEAYPAAWVIHGDDVISFEDLTSGPLATIIEPGTVETFDTTEWAGGLSTADELRKYVELLNRSLRDDLGSVGIRYRGEERIYAFRGRIGEADRKVGFRNVRRKTRVTVVRHYVRHAKDGREFPCLRHTAMRARFRELGGSWYLEIEPTYVFTSDGKEKHRFHEDLLAGIKRLERNRAVLSQVMLWGAVLAPEPTLFDARVRHLGFGGIVSLGVDQSIPDSAWGAEDDEDEEATDLDLPLLRLLEELDQ